MSQPHQNPRTGIDPRLPADLALALNVAREAVMWTTQLVSIARRESTDDARLQKLESDLFACCYESLCDLDAREAAVDAVLADLVPVADPARSFGASCAHAAAMELRAQVLSIARDMYRGNLDDLRMVVGLGHLDDIPDDGRAIAGWCERETYAARAARQRTADRKAMADPPAAATREGEGETPPAEQPKRIPKAEAEVLVRDWLVEHAKVDPASITRDAVAIGTGVSTGQVSKTAAWKAFRDRRDAEAKPGTREVPLAERMHAAIPDDCPRPDELAALIEKQEAEQAEESRRHKRRHGPS